MIADTESIYHLTIPSQAAELDFCADIIASVVKSNGLDITHYGTDSPVWHLEDVRAC